MFEAFLAILTLGLSSHAVTFLLCSVLKFHTNSYLIN